MNLTVKDAMSMVNDAMNLVRDDIHEMLEDMQKEPRKFSTIEESNAYDAALKEVASKIPVTGE